MATYMEQAKQYMEGLQVHVDSIEKAYKPLFEAVKDGYGGELPFNLRSTLAFNLIGVKNEMRKMGVDIDAEQKKLFEAAQSGLTNLSNITTDSYVRHVYDVMAASIMTNPLEEFITIRGMDAPYVQLSYYDIIKGTSKSPSVAGEKYWGFDGTYNTDYDYVGEVVTDEILGEGTGVATSFTGTIAFSPVRYATVAITHTYSSGTEVTNGVCSSAGVVTGTNIAAASVINLDTGVFTLNFTIAPDVDTYILISYEFDSINSDQSVIFEAQITTDNFTAKRFPFTTKWTVDTAVRFDKEYNIQLEKDMLDKSIAGANNETAQKVAATLLSGATAAAELVFDKTPPSTKISYQEHRAELIGTFETGGLNIEQAVRKVHGNVVMCGFDALDVLNGLPKDKYEKTGNTTTPGIYVAGQAGGMKILSNLSFAHDKFLVIAKSDDWMMAGYILAYYIPMLVTELYNTSNMGVERNMVSWYGEKMINSKFYNKGKVIKS